MSNPIFQSNYKTMPKVLEHSEKPSETRVGKTLSLRELIQRDLVGMIKPSPAFNAQEFFDEHNFIPDFKSMDLVDIDLWKEALDAQLKEVNATIREEVKERKRIEAEAKAKEERINPQPQPPTV